MLDELTGLSEGTDVGQLRGRSRVVDLVATIYRKGVPKRRPGRAGALRNSGRLQWLRVRAGWIVPLSLQVLHTVMVAPYYHVGSFDDDGNYLMAAHVLARGGGLTTVMPSGAVVVANYLPGYPALLVPVIWIFGRSLLAPRVFSALCTAAVYPLSWTWMEKRRLSYATRTVVLGLLAINPVLATYSSMVMAEAPFLALLAATLLVLEGIDEGVSTRRLLCLCLMLAGLIWIKEAGVGIVLGTVAYLLWRRHWRRAAGISFGVMMLMLPGLVARCLTGSSVVGDRYSGEIMEPTHEGVVHLLHYEVWHNIVSYARSVFRESLLPIENPLPGHGLLYGAVTVVGYSVPLLVCLGAVKWYRRYLGCEAWMVAIYLAETLAYPFTNQRRLVLVLPIIGIWYVFGASAVLRRVVMGARRKVPTAFRIGTSMTVLITTIVAVGPTLSGFTDDYLFPRGVQSSSFAGAPAMLFLGSIGSPKDVVETSYRGSVAYFTGHRTAWSAFVATTPIGPIPPSGRCTVPAVRTYFREDKAKYLLLGDLNRPDVIDSPCLLRLVTGLRSAHRLGAVQLLATRVDDDAVYELLGPGTVQPDASDLTNLVRPTSEAPVAGARGGAYYAAPRGGRVIFDWDWQRVARVVQISIGQVSSRARITHVVVSTCASPGGPSDSSGCRVLATTNGAVGDGRKPDYILISLKRGVCARRLEVAVVTTGSAAIASVNAIGNVGAGLGRAGMRVADRRPLK